MISSFPDYDFIDGKNMYRGIDIGFGGYITSNPGIYENVALLDVQSMHPTSVINMNCFGKYTQKYKDIYDARVLIKHHDYEDAKKLLNGLLTPYLSDEKSADDLAKALKLCLNSTYGLTAASFDNPFRDPRNKNNIVALRGALFMKTLQDEIESRGFRIVSIKTDSIKIVNATKEIVEFAINFAKEYGYTFEFEAAYSRICQVNDADYIARIADPEWCKETYGQIPGENAKHPNEWTVTGAQFAVPYVFKTLFSKDPIEFDDLCETKSVKTAIYLDMNEGLPDGEHNYIFVGRVGRFTPIKPGNGGGLLMREGEDPKTGEVKYSSVTGSKGYRWLESEAVKELGKEGAIDRSYYDRLVNEAVEAISKYGDFEWFVSDDSNVAPYDIPDEPWGNVS